MISNKKPQNNLDAALKSLIFPKSKLNLEFEKSFIDRIGDLYSAGLPRYPAIFARDLAIYGVLAGDVETLKNFIIFACKIQGTKKNTATGEEPGKIFHEYPGYAIDDKSSLYNACDSSAYFLISVWHYFQATKDSEFLEKQKPAILKSVEYIKSHLNKEYIFLEDPQEFVGAKIFALKVTYWKDSVLEHRKNGAPHYPVAYLLNQAINGDGLRKIGDLLNMPEIKELGDKMIQSISYFWSAEKENFAHFIDDEGAEFTTTSDVLFMLFHLENGDLSSEQISSISKSAENLETLVGFRTMSYEESKSVTDSYHSRTIWPFEQAIIHSGAKKFNLKNIALISERVYKYILKGDQNWELFETSDKCTNQSNLKFNHNNQNPQLWTIGAKIYFENLKNI